MASSQQNLSFLELVSICDNVNLRRHSNLLRDINHQNQLLVPLYLYDKPDSPAIGLLVPDVLEQLVRENVRSAENGKSPLWNLRLDASSYIHERNGIPASSASFSGDFDTPSKRTAAMKELCERWRDTGLFSDICGPKKWRNEPYPIYADPFGPYDHPTHRDGDEDGLNFAFEMERSATSLFGVVTYGVHMSIYDEVVNETGQKSLRVWVPTRALTKPTWPGYLDNTVAGGIPSGMPPFESMVKECMEEASIEAEVVRKHARAVGSISYFFRSARGYLQPEVEYIYDIRIPVGADHEAFTPRPLDGEVESFELVSHEKLIDLLRSGLFKPNCAVVIIDLLIRLGYISPDNEPDFMKIITRIHGNFGYEQW